LYYNVFMPHSPREKNISTADLIKLVSKKSDFITTDIRDVVNLVRA